MSNVLRPFGDFKEPEKLAGRLYDLASRNEDYLDERNYPLVSSLYGQSPADAEAWVRHAQREHSQLKIGHFAVMNGDYEVVGSASIWPHIPLRQRRPLALKLPFATPEIRAWVDIGEGNDGLDTLMDAYQELLVQSRFPGWKKANGVAWTLEPPSVGFNRPYHEAIKSAGLVEVDTRRYSNQGKSKKLPESTLYAALPGDWSNHSAKAKEQALRRYK